MATAPPIPQRDLLHLRPGEVALFRRFERLDPLASPTYQFDTHLGQGMPLDPSWPAWLQAMATRLTQKRVDVVATTPTATWLLEMKPRAGPSAVGQLLTYRSIFLREFPQLAPFLIGVIADRNSFDMQDVYDEFNIQLFLV